MERFVVWNTEVGATFLKPHMLHDLVIYDMQDAGLKNVVSIQLINSTWGALAARTDGREGLESDQMADTDAGRALPRVPRHDSHSELPLDSLDSLEAGQGYAERQLGRASEFEQVTRPKSVFTAEDRSTS
jgi:hypothetical protein